MITHDLLAALPALAVRALVESALVGALLAGAVWLVVGKLVPMRAAARHTLWSLALVAIATLPLASIGTSLTHINRIAAANIASSTHDSSERVAGNVATDADVLPTMSRAAMLPTRTFRPPSLTIPESIALAALAIWALGAAAGFVVLGASIWRVQGLRRRSSPLEGSLAGELPWLTEAHAREIYLRLSYEIETPVAIGFGRPVILIPTELAMKDGLGAIEDLVMHEHAHLRRYDDYTNLVQRVLERLFWFNPIVWLVGERIALEREIASDDCVVAQTGHAEAYAESLWRLAKEMRMPEHAIVAPGAMLTRKQITVRIERLLDAKRDLLPKLSPAALITLGVGSALAVLTMTVSAPAIELPAPTVAANLPDPVRAKRAPVAKPNFVIGAARKTIALQEWPAVPQPAPSALVVPPAPISSPAHPLTIHIHPVIPDINIEIPDIEMAPRSSGSRASHSASGPIPGEVVASCTGCTFRGRNLSGIDLSNKQLNGIDLRDVELRGANLDNADLRNARLNGTSLVDVSMNNTQLGGIALTGVTIGHLHPLAGQISRDLLRDCSGCDLRDAILRGADLHGLHLSGIDMRGADLTGADLHDAQLDGVDLRGAKLTGANLHNAQLIGCDLRDARMRGANVTGATFTGSNLSESLF